MKAPFGTVADFGGIIAFGFVFNILFTSSAVKLTLSFKDQYLGQI